jgi:hypothetical protein
MLYLIQTDRVQEESLGCNSIRTVELGSAEMRHAIATPSQLSIATGRCSWRPLHETNLIGYVALLAAIATYFLSTNQLSEIHAKAI